MNVRKLAGIFLHPGPDRRKWYEQTGSMALIVVAIWSVYFFPKSFWLFGLLSLYILWKKSLRHAVEPKTCAICKRLKCERELAATQIGKRRVCFECVNRNNHLIQSYERVQEALTEIQENVRYMKEEASARSSAVVLMGDDPESPSMSDK
jgi:hypothetical protein